MAKIFARIRRPSLRWGLLFGIILGVVGAVYNLALNFVMDANTQSILEDVLILIFLALGFYAGLRAAQETGKWTSGLAAGLWVGVIGTVLASLIPVVSILINLQNIVANLKAHPDPTTGMKPSDYTASVVLLSVLFGLLTEIVNNVLFTLIGGALGGFIGRRRALAVAFTGQNGEVPAIEQESIVEASSRDEAETTVVEKTEVIGETEPAEIGDEATK